MLLWRPGWTTAICCWLDATKPSMTSYSESWTLQCEWWAAQRNDRAVWDSSVSLSCTGSMWQIGLRSSPVWRCKSVFTVKRRLTVRAVYAGRSSRPTTAPSFGQPPPTRRAKNTSRNVRPSCIRRGWSDRMERNRLTSASPASVAYLKSIWFSSTRCTEHIRNTVQ